VITPRPKPPPKTGRAAPIAKSEAARKLINSHPNRSISVFLGTVADEAMHTQRRLQRAIVSATLAGVVEQRQAITNMKRLGFGGGAQ